MTPSSEVGSRDRLGRPTMQVGERLGFEPVAAVREDLRMRLQKERHGAAHATKR
jgi:hypothetical protein